MDKEIIDKKFKHEIEYLKIYMVFIIVLGTGDVSLFLKNGFPLNRIELSMFITGGIFFVIFVILFIQSYFKSKRLSRKL